MCPHSPARITPEKHRGEAMLSGHSRVPPGDNKLIWDVFHALREFKVIIFCLVTYFHT